MNVGSLFAGIGGVDLGLERAGMHTVWQVEQDPFRRAVLTKHFPGAERFEDVRAVGAHNLEWVDVIGGGFPCQDISDAGPRTGLAGDRSGLWGEMFRVVRELRPRYVVVENVSALLRRGFSRVLADLASIGYDAEWDCLRAADFGAPHLRDRVWIIAYPNADGERLSELAPGNGRSSEGVDVERGRDPDGLRAHGADAAWPRLQGRGSAGPGRRQQPRRGGGQGAVADAEGSPIGTGLCPHEPASLRRGRLGDGGGEAGAWTVEPDVGRVAHGIPARVDRLSALGDALVPQIAEWIGQRILEWERVAA